MSETLHRWCESRAGSLGGIFPVTTINELLSLSRSLTESDSARLDAELLLAFCLGKNRSYLYAWPEREVADDVAKKFCALIQRRSAGEPIAYLIGERDFWSLSLDVDSSTLIPRPDTEKLVEIALQLPGTNKRVLDLGTGTGAIALALAKERRDWQVTGVDITPDAVRLAQRNAEKNGIANAQFRASDWFETIDGRFDLIVSNPPYIAADDPHLDIGDVRFEPRRALVAETDGMAAIEVIAEQAPHYLSDGGWLLVEHGWQQGEAARAVFAHNGFTAITTWRDDGGRDRVTGGRRRSGHE